ncbi:hypothetical protein MFRU_015g00170 [Monilinia fructicola]|nr:hypothetical protein MFRU_015g00170 [Monilinia fructicola]
MPPISNVIDANERVALLVGTERFTSTAETLVSKSKFFENLFSPSWARPKEDGSYFGDADPTLFAHILQYLRRDRFPIFYDNSKGHDYAMYIALRQEADYFGLGNLANWLKDKKYLDVVKVSYSFEEFESSAEDIAILKTTLTNAKLELLPQWSKTKIYLCPRGLLCHRGHPNLCGRQCLAARQALGVQWEEKNILGGVLLKQTTIIDEELCFDKPFEEDLWPKGLKTSTIQ